MMPRFAALTSVVRHWKTRELSPGTIPKEANVADIRKDQAKLTRAEWQKLVHAIDQLHGTSAARPAYRDFVKLHMEAMTTMTGMTWEVHTMPGMGMIGRNFLSWHRRYVRSFEQRLQKAVPGVTVPYWDWTKNRAIPAALSDPALLTRWSVDRDEFDETLLPTQGIVNQVLALTPFTPFQRNLEAIHGGVHNAVGGDMATAHSPSDPLFFLHHANVDRLWAKWQKSAKAADPPNASASLKPGGTIISGKVSAVLDIAKLGYAYR
jgi:tyrosinase